MNILLFHPDKGTLDMMVFCLESQMSLSVTPVTSFQSAVDCLLDESSVDLIITSHQPETDKLFKYLLSTGSQIPVILVSNQDTKFLDAYPDIQILGHLTEADVPERLFHLIQANFQKILDSGLQSEYCRINTELLVRVAPLKSDIYIRISNVKFVKLFKAGAVFTQEDLEKFLVRRKVSYLYIKKQETQEFVMKFKEDLSQLVQSAPMGDPSLLNTVTEVHTLIQDLSNRLGFTEQVQEIARENVQLTIKAVGKSPRLTKALSNSQFKSRNYISSHSVLLASISCSIAAQMRWPSETTFHKLTLASLFHDFSFQDAELAKLSTKAEVDSMKASLTPEQFDVLKNHPIHGAEAVKNLKEIPGDVDFLILQHHERPDGSGFPKGLRGPQIAPLAAVFIVAHDIIDAITKLGSGFNLVEFLKDKEAEYRTGSFRAVWQVLAQESQAEDANKPAA